MISPLLLSMLLIGLINGAFYALLSIGMSVIFGMLNIVNFAHGTFFMMGAFAAWLGMQWLGIGYWWALLLSPLVVGAIGVVIERSVFRRIYQLDHIYGFLLSYGLAIVLEGLFRNVFGSSGRTYPVPELLQGATNLGFMYVPVYRSWVVLIALATCIAVWLTVERTSLGAKLRAITENAPVVRMFGIRVQLLSSFAFFLGIAMAAFAGVLAAPIYSVHPQMGSNLVILAFAVVVIGGMGSILGTVTVALALGLVEGVTRAYYPPAAGSIVFVLMILILLLRPAGLFGARDASPASTTQAFAPPATSNEARGFFGMTRAQRIAFAAMTAVIALAPALLYPLFLTKILCFALFACAFNLLAGYAGLLSFGHAAFFGVGGYLAAWTMKHAGLTPELTVVCGALLGGALGGAFGWVAIRRQGLYFSMITLGLAQMIYFICLQAPFTGGEDGIQDVPRGMLFGLFPLGSDVAMYAFTAAVFLIGFLFTLRVVDSPFGNVLAAARDNAPRAVSLGYKVDRYKLLAFVISAALAGAAGSLKAIAFGIATLPDVHFGLSGEVVLITLLGGLGTLFGPVVGALIMVSLEYMLAGLGSWVTLIQGLIFIVCVLTFRRGVVGEIAHRFKVSL